MPFSKINPKMANDPLGPGTLNAMRGNIAHNRMVAMKEHLISTGEHNAWEVSRRTFRVTGTTVTPAGATSDITAVTNPSAGRWVLTLAAGRFTTDIRVEINPQPESVKPLIASFKIISATSIEVYIHKLSSALGAVGNTWALVNTSFDIAIHSAPLAQTAWSSGLPVLWGRNAAANGYGLAGGGSNSAPFGWSSMVLGMATLQQLLTAAHTSAGVHNVREVAKAAGRVYWDSAGSKYTSVQSPFSGYTYTRSSAGIILIDHPAWTAPINSFVYPDYSRYSAGSDSPIVINAVDTSTTRTTITIYQWITPLGWWQAADADFFLTQHQG